MMRSIGQEIFQMLTHKFPVVKSLYCFFFVKGPLTNRFISKASFQLVRPGGFTEENRESFFGKTLAPALRRVR